MTRLLCVADLHLGKGRAYERVPGERLAEQERVWLTALEIGYERDVDAVLFAGDIFEGPIPLPEHYTAFSRPLDDWDDERYPIPIIAINGNGRHDASTRDSNAVEVIGSVGGVHVHTKPGIRTLASGLAIATLPWVPVSRLVAAENGGDRDELNARAAQLLVEAARGLRAGFDGPMILMTHFSISGAAVPGGALTDQLREPVLPLGDLERLGFDAIVAGHIHRPQVLSGGVAEPGVTGSAAQLGDPVRPSGDAPIFYTGSPLPLDFGEGSMDHGVWILTLDDAPVGAMRSFVPEFVPIESRRFETLLWDHEEDPDVVVEMIRGDHSQRERCQGSYVKARFTATAEAARSIDTVALRHGLLAAGAHNVWVEPIIERETRARVEGLDESIDDVTALTRWIDTNVDGDDLRKSEILDLGTRYLEGAPR